MAKWRDRDERSGAVAPFSSNPSSVLQSAIGSNFPELKPRLILRARPDDAGTVAEFGDISSGICLIPEPDVGTYMLVPGIVPTKWAGSHRMSHHTIIPLLHLNSIAIPGNSKISCYIYMQLDGPEFPTVVCFYDSLPTSLRHCQQALSPIRLFGTLFGILIHYHPGGAFLVIRTLAHLPHGLEVPNTTPLHMPTKETKRVCRLSTLTRPDPALHWNSSTTPEMVAYGRQGEHRPTIFLLAAICMKSVVSRRLGLRRTNCTCWEQNTILGLRIINDHDARSLPALYVGSETIGGVFLQVPAPKVRCLSHPWMTRHDRRRVLFLVNPDDTVVADASTSLLCAPPELRAASWLHSLCPTATSREREKLSIHPCTHRGIEPWVAV
ncbi:hypothetical protein B0H17DRAFT_1138923 [Mycena rosella]|uniref:Uncharacterized protein n=1 Tax=Mycena rosella TaxID=1033263 RepID=A0AAD7GDQ5_MYCRO|nr:hypothetical protein B0H17DRAFT_1138923 [Mycena rosella]